MGDLVFYPHPIFRGDEFLAPSFKNLELFIREQAEEAKRTEVPQQLKQKLHYRKFIRMKKQKVMSQIKGQDKTPEKQLNEVEIGNLPEKEFRIIIVNKIQDLQKRMETKFEKMQEIFTKDLQEQKNKQTEMNNTLLLLLLSHFSRV